MATPRYFTPALFAFLSDLRRNNTRPWFLKHRERFETLARDPVLRFIADLRPHMRKLSPQIVVDPSPVGGSMMRIYRDVRFARDKSPYKTSIIAHFGMKRGGDGPSPAFYLYLSPRQSSVGAGIWRPEPAELTKIRDAIVDDPARWRRATSARGVSAAGGMHEDSLKRVPRGFDPDHPLAQDLKRRSFALSAPLTDAQVVAPGVLQTVMTAFRASAPFVRLLSEALNLPF